MILDIALSTASIAEDSEAFEGEQSLQIVCLAVYYLTSDFNRFSTYLLVICQRRSVVVTTFEVLNI